MKKTIIEECKKIFGMKFKDEKKEDPKISIENKEKMYFKNRRR